MPVCSPADPDACVEGSACLLADNVDSTSLGALCAGGFETGEAGTACEDDDDCGSGFGCAPQTGTCALWCDDAHPCEGDTPCTPFARDVDVPGLGFCLEP